MRSSKHPPITYQGRSIGILILTVAQVLIGTIHLLIGFGLIAAEATKIPAYIAYDTYTVAFGAVILFFSVFIWRGAKAGWVGTVAALAFVAVADTLTVLRLPSIPGIPMFAAPTEIIYSLLVIIYLGLPHVRKKFGLGGS